MSMCGTFIQITNDRLEQLTKLNEIDEDNIDDLIEEKDPNMFCSVEKSWHTLHYLLTGESWEGEGIEAQVILGGTEVGPDLGYGPLRYLTADEVKTVVSALDKIEPADLQTRFDPEAMATAGLYAFSTDYAQDELEMAMDYFVELKSFYRKAAHHDHAVLLLIT